MLPTDETDRPAQAAATRPALAAFANSYARLPEHFYARLGPTAVARPRLVKFNFGLAEELGLSIDAHDADALAAMLSGNAIPAGAEPIALAYAGHQFGNFVPQLGDGRAVLLGEVIDRQGRRRDIQLKGSGRTPFSRMGDGRAALGPVLREYIVSEAMHALGIPTTRSLAVVTTGEPVFRETTLPGAVLTRVASSHIRVGTFQYFAARDDEAAIGLLVDTVIERHYPEIKGADPAHAVQPALALLRAIVERQAYLVARWMQVGFIHGVMNTDNMALSGETIDYGPCAFMDAYDPGTVFSAIDRFGRYGFANQPGAARWNLARFAETLLTVIDPTVERAIELANEAIGGFAARFEMHWLSGMRAKIGLEGAEEGDLVLIQSLLEAMHRNQADFTLTFRRLADAAESPAADASVRELFADPSAFDAWAAAWRARDGRVGAERAGAMRRVNPAVIPRNHRVEQALAAAIERADFAPFEELNTVLSKPFDDLGRLADYEKPAQPEERVTTTFCGT